MELVITCGGTVRCLYSEELDLSALGRLTIVRGSHVEPNEQGQWLADLSPARCWDHSGSGARPWTLNTAGWSSIG